jgi:hypothetical protein
MTSASVKKFSTLSNADLLRRKTLRSNVLLSLSVRRLPRPPKQLLKLKVRRLSRRKMLKTISNSKQAFLRWRWKTWDAVRVAKYLLSLASVVVLPHLDLERLSI